MHHADRIRTVARDPAASGRSALFASWTRSLTRYKLDPLASAPPCRLTDAELRHARVEMEPLLAASQATLDRLCASVGGAGCCVLFTNTGGIPVDRRGTCADDHVFESWGLWPGTIWSEAAEGTNGIGTCLAEGRPVLIHRDQHFYARNTGLSCAVAPIHDHRGRLAAALDVSSCRDDLTEDVARLIASAVGEAARRIEARFFAHAFPHARIVVPPEVDAVGALLAIDSDDMIVGATHTARQACRITDAALARGLPARDVLPPACDVEENFASAERTALQRALARSRGNVSKAAKSLGVSRATLHRKLNRAGLPERCGRPDRSS